MKEELENALIEVINSATAAKDFVVAEAPEVIEQLLVWKMAESLILSVIGLALLVSVPTLVWKISEHWERIKEERGPQGERETGDFELLERC